MQTFLPFSDFNKCGKVLDNDRIGNQVYREVKTLINGGWPNHPASKMWRGYEYHLCDYALCLIDAMETRRHPDGNVVWRPEVIRKWRKYYTNLQFLLNNLGLPPWLGDEDFHASHRSNLLRKKPEWYGQFGWTEPDNLPYIWPKGK